jgi:hypothetical protein
MALIKVRDLAGWVGEVWLVQDDKTQEFFVVSRAFTLDRGDETMIFAASEEGKATSWADLYAGCGVSHEEAMAIFAARRDS